MCGIVGAVAERDVVPLLQDGLHRLEYRGYDSAGLAVIPAAGPIGRRRALGRVDELDAALEQHPLSGHAGIAHTRWATHGAPHERNAHPHVSGERIALVHNGIIENHRALRRDLEAAGYEFTSDTDTEVIAHRIHQHLDAGQGDLLDAVRATVAELDGAFALAVIERDRPDRIVVARQGCPVILGVGIGEHFVASDVPALLAITRRFVQLEEGDVAEITRHHRRIIDREGHEADRPEFESDLSADAVERGIYRHYMLKEIHEQPRAVADTLAERIADDRILDAAFGFRAGEIFPRVRGVHIVACGTSFHAALVARYQIERLARIPVNVEIASEYRYRSPVVPDDTLFVTISQSGETADTLAALREARQLGYLATMAICNVPESSLVRESDLVLMTRAGPEIGVASTKAFTTQLTALAMLSICLGRHADPAFPEAAYVAELRSLPARIERLLELDAPIRELAEHFVERQHALFLGRGVHYPIAMEGALKLKEISYIHAEAYAAGELKHGPLALIDNDMPVVAIAPNDSLAEKLASNLQEVHARGGRLFIFADAAREADPALGAQWLAVPGSGDGSELLDPVLYTVPLQLLAYHVAVLKGTDVDKPRNLAKSVTVE
jgi:glutamine---fructose-6-phosphate transaminase (isomerizing)